MIFLFWWNRHPVAPIYNSQRVTQGAADTSLPDDAGTYLPHFQHQVLAPPTEGRA